MIVVLDSGIWVSAFQFGGTPQAVLDSVFLNHTLAICDPILSEVRAVLIRKFSWKDEEVLAILHECVSDSILVDITGSLVGVCRDPKDDMILECASKAEAQVIVSGDNDLLVLKEYAGIGC